MILQQGLHTQQLSGICKQSVKDVECLLSPSLVLSMENKGYHHEAEYLKHVCNWRHASDERGLTDDQRSEFNAGLLNYILCHGIKRMVCEILAY